MNIAVIPARANSQGVPGKNYRVINGRPLIEWSILAATQCSYVGHTVVSTNDPLVEEAAVQYCLRENLWNVTVVKRPAEISGPDAKSEDALVHAVEWVHTHRKWDVRWVAMLQPTSPVRNNAILAKCFDVVNDEEEEFDSLLTCSVHTPFFYSRSPRSLKAFPLNHVPCHRPMRQSLRTAELLFHDNGNVYITDAIRLLETRCRIGAKPALYHTTAFQSWQIDAEEDFVVLEAMAKAFGAFV